MAIEIKQQFEVNAPAEQVWAFVMDPHRVAPCMPGATLDEVIDDKNFRGSVRIKVGAVSAAYKGSVCMQKADQAAGLLEMLAEGRETGGGTARATMTATVTAGDNGTTAVTVFAAVDITGRLMQVGGRMIQGVSDQLFKQFVRKLKAELEAGAASSGAGTSSAPASLAISPGTTAPAPADNAIRVLPLLLRTLAAAIVRLFRRLLGRG
ncbi:MAG TPA: carbon monoxide dehydrogenase [Deltaproteobacteria bacterium]|nr:carbon monoxide dehydrogenase [Candidatus Binatota bacterium]HIL13246.1 carbon monoxide dehydrogenase [Deltaproteobacteria bacterium]